MMERSHQYTDKDVKHEGSFLNLLIPERSEEVEPSTFFIGKSKPVPTIVYDTYWRFAALRQEAFFQKISDPMARSSDPVLKTYKFTNAYRASDRVSQYLIRQVIYEGSQDVEEVFFRTILFKLFNKIDTWELLKKELGEISWANFDIKSYDRVLSKAMSSGVAVYSAAYIMASAKSAFGCDRKHSNHLFLLQKMMKEKAALRIQQMSSMEDVYELLLSYPGIGNFLAFQYTIDLNYGPITNFDENEFVVAGPGALSGIAKCFSDLAGWSTTDVIRHMMEHQDIEFERLDIHFKTMWGRPLHLIDCQNLFCETDKYSRVFHPDMVGEGGRKRIKQAYKPLLQPIDFFFPPKWGINEAIHKG